MSKDYFYIVMSQQDLLKNQAIEEIIRERNNYYINRNNSLNFWIVMSPSFLESDEIINTIKKTNFFHSKYNEVLKNNKFYSAVIISTDIEYINWLKLRLGYFENLFNQQESNNYSFRSDGLYGKIESSDTVKRDLFKTKKNNIHPDILLNVYEKAFQIFLN